MSALDSLVRLHRWQLDDRRRQLAELDGFARKLRLEQERLAAELRNEQQAAAQSLDAATAYGAYAKRVIDRRVKIEQSLAAVEQQIALARDALAEAYQEVKRYEIAAANRTAQRRKHADRQQQRTLDEIGIDAFRRRNQGGA
jgi:flagellar export protein FliJ